MNNIMDLDTDLLYLGGETSGVRDGAANGAGGRSFTSYTSQRDRLYDKYGLIGSGGGGGGGGGIGGTTSTSALDKYSSSITTTAANSSLYRPSTLTFSANLNKHTPTTAITNHSTSDVATSAMANNTISNLHLYSSSSSNAPITNHHSAAIDKLISSSSYLQREPAFQHSSLLTSNTGGSGSLSHLHQAANTTNTTTTTTSTLTNTTNTAATTTSTSHMNHQDLPTANQNTSSVHYQGGGGGGGASSRVQSSLGQHLLQQLFDDMRQIEDTVDSIEIPARGRCKVYMAKYGYDPFKQSPNDNPDAELAFNAGDYIMVFDDIDEDGYFIGELMDGRRGYVPSNWLDRLTGEDLFEFQATTLYKQPKDDEGSESNSYPPEFYDAIVSDTMNHSNFQHLLAPEDYHRMNDYVDLDDVNEVDDECLSDYERAEAEQMRRAVPPPQRLVLERQLNKSILIGWLHPQAAKGTIVSYQVYVDGVLKSTVPSGDRTKALLEGVDSNIPHRISVRAIDLSGQHSNDAGCTIVIGQKIPFAPSCVKSSHITSDSALISWLPCNSNFHHVVAVNSVEVQTVRPGVYKHLINGLSANTLYRVWVRAKPGKILSIDEKNPKKLESLTTYVDFKTMPKSLPDPPVNVQVEAGPQRRTLLVTWLPLTLNDFGSSNGCAVTGYAVFAGHKKLADIDSPTGDHALLDLSDLESLHKKSVTVRTKSGENLSQDSMPCHIPDEYLKAAASKSTADHQTSGHHHQQQLTRHGGNQQQQHHQRLSDSAGGHHSPMRSGNHMNHHHQRYSNEPRHHLASSAHQPHQQQLHHPQSRLSATGSRYSMARGRQMARSLQNLESDLDSRRSSIPAIEITRETSSSDHNINPAESYSEEEFENSMRFRGLRNKPAQRMNPRYRTRQSHSVDSSVPPHLGGAARFQQQQQQANLMTTTSGKFKGNPSYINERDIRYFVALFDYDPSTMSPNPNAASEELAFKEGSIIKIFGDKGPDGFYQGELENHIGYVPSNVVSEITDPNMLYNLQEKNNRQMIQQQQQGNLQVNYMQQRPGQQQPQSQQQQQQQLDGQQQNGVKRMTALYDYDPQENSPNADTESEIPFKVGDVIYVYGKMDTDGFYMGEVERTKQRGLVPSNFLREDPLPGANKPGGMIQQQPGMFNQVNNQMMTTGNPLDPFQQQQQQARSLNPGSQFNGTTVQQPAGLPMNQPVGAFSNNNQAQQQQVNQQQQLNKQMNMPNANQLRSPNIRGILPTQSQRGPVDSMLQSSQQQNINRPTSLSLVNSNPQMGSASDWNNNQQRQQQLMQGGGQIQPQSMQPNNLVGNMMNQQGQFNTSMGQQGQLPPMQQGQQQQYLQQQQIGNNQQPGGGVLSNLLSSGKQMIGAATTPRNPNQPSQFPSGMNQMGNLGAVDVNKFPPARGNQMMMTQPAQANAAFNQQQLGDPTIHQQLGHNPFATLSGNQQQVGPAYNQVGSMNRGPMGGEEQGGNILNTVKNMFKL